MWNVLSQGIHMLNMKVLWLVVRKLWPRLKFLFTHTRQHQGYDISSPDICPGSLKRKRSDLVLWFWTENSKKQSDNTKTRPKTWIPQRLRTQLGRSVGVINVYTCTQLAWLEKQVWYQYIFISNNYVSSDYPSSDPGEVKNVKSLRLMDRQRDGRHTKTI